ncbi:heavy metal translocating P-type ATPase [Haloparvum sp. PAK95]|uniref:heavy metal translocating P-type ATPase n=1 Tax=Haloparvum sp. PAK95 TaxID=3418962 RepID=UPI003D2F3FD2
MSTDPSTNDSAQSTSDPAHDACTLCELPAAETGVVDDDGNQFCCPGCRDVYDALGDVDGVSEGDVREAHDEGEAGGPVGVGDEADAGADAGSEATADVPDDHEATFFEVQGMHCATCEAFIESVATAEDGVSDASASYVTETVRIDHDPDAVVEDELRDAVSGLGYDAYPRDDAFSRRQADHMATARLAVGVLLGMMVMLQYVAIIYPTYFDGLFYNDRTAAFLADAMASTSGTYFFILLAVLTTVILLFTGKPILRGAYVSARTRSPNMDLLVALAAVSAYLYSNLTVITGGSHVYYDVTVAIIVIVTVGNHYETSVKRRATDLLSDLTAVQVDEARRVVDDGHETVAIDELSAGDRLLVKNGERVPVDGTVVDGEGAVDEAVVTGESLPVHKAEGDTVVGGSVVADGALVVSVDEGATSSLDRISELVWDLQSSNHGIQGLADRLATVFVPLVLALAVAAAATYLALGAGVTEALLVGLTVLIVSCPCALGLATPLAVASGVRDALERSIVVFDETVFERIRDADTVVFDKTGTLTTGDMRVVDADVPDDLLRAAAALETRSSHPVGQAVAMAGETGADGAGDATGDASDDSVADGGQVTEVEADQRAAGDVSAFESHRKGVSGVVDGAELLVGHPDLFRDRGWDLPAEIAERAEDARDLGRVPVIIGRNGAAEGLVVVGDELRDGWEATLESLTDRGIEVVVLTGDEERAAATFRDHPAIARVFAGVPPEGKAETVSRLSETGDTVMVGDGTNDAPALATADLGIALGGGTAMAADAADVAIVDDDLASVGTVFDLASAAGTRVKQNIGWAFCYNAVAIPLAVLGLLNPLFAAVAMGTSSLLVVTNSSRDLLSS